MKILALDTSTEACSAALFIDHKISTKSEIAPRRHAELILPMIDSLLNEAGLKLAQLHAIAFGRGPGAFTGVRIAAGVTQGLAYASNLPVIPISSLAALAQTAVTKADSIIAAIDARMGEIYYCQYRTLNNQVKARSAEAVLKPTLITPDLDSPLYGVGTGWETYTTILTEKCQGKLAGYEAQAFPLAQHIAELAVDEYNHGRLKQVKEAVPVYLRNKVTG